MELQQHITSNFSNNTDSQNIPETHNKFCSENYVRFFHDYNKIDHQVKVFVGGLGLIGNLINIYVFTRKEMRNPLNTILLALAVADGLFLLTVFTANSFMWLHLASGNFDVDFGESDVEGLSWKTSRRLAVVYTVYTNFYYFFHYCTIYLMILVALWRMLGITFPLKSRKWLTERSALCGILTTVVIAFVITATYFGPVEIYHAVIPVTVAELGTRQAIIYFPGMSKTAENVMYWTYAICVKIIPSLMLSIFTVVLLRSLLRARKGRSEMMMTNSTPATNSTSASSSSSSSSFDRTTKLLLTLVLIFLVTETPDALLTILFVLVKVEGFNGECLSPPVYFLMTLECLSSFSSFFIYLGMSTPFQNVLMKTIKNYRMNK